mgnify:FL=1
MRVHVVIDESGFFLPSYLEHVTRYLPEGLEITGVTVLMNPPSVPTVYSHLRSHRKDIGVPSCMRLGWKVLEHLTRELASMSGLPVRPGSVFRTARSLGLPVRRVVLVNALEALRWIASGTPDLVLSSCSQVFRKELLALPQIGAINRHSSLLPSYGGILPMFQALTNGEKHVGTSIHVMTPGIDRGVLVAQSAFSVTEEMTLYDCYDRSYSDSGPLTVESLLKIRDLGSANLDKADFGVRNDLERSYFGLPTKEDWERFHQAKRRFC